MIMAGEVEAPKIAQHLQYSQKIAPDSQRFASYSHRIRTVFAKIRTEFAVFANWSKTYSLGFAHIRIQSHRITSGHTCECARSSLFNSHRRCVVSSTVYRVVHDQLKSTSTSSTARSGLLELLPCQRRWHLYPSRGDPQRQRQSVQYMYSTGDVALETKVVLRN